MDEALVRCGSWPTCGQSFGETWYEMTGAPFTTTGRNTFLPAGRLGNWVWALTIGGAPRLTKIGKQINNLNKMPGNFVILISLLNQYW
jgi:hypothetical protein